MENKKEIPPNFNSLSLATLIYNMRLKNEISIEVEKKINLEIIKLEQVLIEKLKNEMVILIKNELKNESSTKEDWEYLEHNEKNEI